MFDLLQYLLFVYLSPMSRGLKMTFILSLVSKTNHETIIGKKMLQCV